MAYFRSYRVRLRAHALRRGKLSASSVALTRPLLGLSFIYHPTPRLRHCVACLGLMVLRPAGGRGLRIPLACGSPSLQIAIWRVFRGPKIVNQRVPNLWDTYTISGMPILVFNNAAGCGMLNLHAPPSAQVRRGMPGCRAESIQNPLLAPLPWEESGRAGYSRPCTVCRLYG